MMRFLAVVAVEVLMAGCGGGEATCGEVMAHAVTAEDLGLPALSMCSGGACVPVAYAVWPDGQVEVGGWGQDVCPAEAYLVVE